MDSPLVRYGLVVLICALMGLAVPVLILLLGLGRILIVLPFLLNRGIALEPELDQLLSILPWLFAGGLAAGILVGLLSPLARWTLGLFFIGILAGTVFMAGVAVSLYGWQGWSALNDFSVWGLGTLFGSTGAYAIWEEMRKDTS